MTEIHPWGSGAQGTCAGHAGGPRVPVPSGTSLLPHSRGVWDGVPRSFSQHCGTSPRNTGVEAVLASPEVPQLCNESFSLFASALTLFSLWEVKEF